MTLKFELSDELIKINYYQLLFLLELEPYKIDDYDDFIGVTVAVMVVCIS